LSRRSEEPLRDAIRYLKDVRGPEVDPPWQDAGLEGVGHDYVKFASSRVASEPATRVMTVRAVLLSPGTVSEPVRSAARLLMTDRNTGSASQNEIVVFDECYVADCTDPPAVEAIGTYDCVFGIEQTVALALCRRHADAVGDELVVLEVA